MNRLHFLLENLNRRKSLSNVLKISVKESCLTLKRKYSECQDSRVVAKKLLVTLPDAKIRHQSLKRPRLGNCCIFSSFKQETHDLYTCCFTSFSDALCHVIRPPRCLKLSTVPWKGQNTKKIAQARHHIFEKGIP